MKYQVYTTSNFQANKKILKDKNISNFLETNKELSDSDITTIPYSYSSCYKTIHRRYNLWFAIIRLNDITLYIPKDVEDRSNKSYFNIFTRDELEKKLELTDNEIEEIKKHLLDLLPKEKTKLLPPDMEIYEGIRDFSESSTSFVYEMKNWTININKAECRDSYQSIFESLKDIVLNNGKENGEKVYGDYRWKIKELTDGSKLQIIYRINYGINSKYFFLYDIVKKSDLEDTLTKLAKETDKNINKKKENADSSLSEEEKSFFAKFEEFGDDNLKRQAQKGYPDFVMSSDLKTWKKIENNEDANLALSEEEIDTLQEYTHYPCFINGLAGSGKSTILFYLFVNAYLYQISLPKSKRKKMIFLSQSDKLVDSARDVVTALATTNYKRWTAKKTEQEIKKEEEKIKNGLQNCFKTFDSFMRDNYLSDEKAHDVFPENNHIDFNKFKEMFNNWPLTNKKLSAEKVWAVIRTFVRGKNYRTVLTTEEYETDIIDTDKTVSVEEYREIFELHEKYYSKRKDKQEWDDLDMVAHILKKIELGNPYEQYDVIFCDEAQDFTPIEILLILKSSEYYNYNLASFKAIPIAFAGDPNQTISPTGFNWNRLKDIFTNTFKEQIGDYIKLSDVTLNNNYRSKSNIIKLSNSIQYIRGVLSKSKLLPQNEWNVNDNPIPGFISISDEMMPIIGSLLKHSDFIITGNDGTIVNKDKMLDNQEDERLYTSISAKGLEANTVILYKFADDMPDCFTKLFEGKELNSDEVFKCEHFITKLYVAITRTREILYIIDTIPNYERFWYYLDNNLFVTTKLQADTRRIIWENKTGGIEKPSKSELNRTDGKSNLEKRFIEMSNRAVIAERIFNNAKFAKDLYLMKRAKGYFSLCLNEEMEKECEAYIFRYERQYEKSGDFFYALSKSDEAIKSYWIGRCWSKLAEYAEDDKKYFAQYCLAAINLDHLISYLSENEKQWIKHYSLSDETWNFIVEKIQKDAVCHYDKNTDVLHFIESKLQNECGLKYLGDTVAKLYFCQNNFAQAVNNWERINKTEHHDYYTSKKMLAIESNNYDEIIKWEFYLGETESIISQFGNSNYKLNNSSKSIVFHLLLSSDYLSALNYEWNDEYKINSLYYEDRNKFLEYYVLNNFTPNKYYTWVEDKVKNEEDFGIFNDKINQHLFTKIFNIGDEWILFLSLKDNAGNRLFFSKQYNDAIIKSLSEDIIPNMKFNNVASDANIGLCFLDAVFGDYYESTIANDNNENIAYLLKRIPFNRTDFYNPLRDNYFNRCGIVNNGVKTIKKNFSLFLTKILAEKQDNKTSFEKYCIFYEKLLNNSEDIIKFYESIPDVNKTPYNKFINFRTTFYKAIANEETDGLNIFLNDNSLRTEFLSYFDRDDVRNFIELAVKKEEIIDKEVYLIANYIYRRKITKDNYKSVKTPTALEIFVNKNLVKELGKPQADESLIKLLCYVGETVMEKEVVINMYNDLLNKNVISNDLKEYIKVRMKIGIFGKDAYPEIEYTQNKNKPALSQDEKNILQKKEEIEIAKNLIQDKASNDDIEAATELSKYVIMALKLKMRNTSISTIARATKFSEEFIKRL